MPSRFLKESITASESLDNLTEAEEAFFLRLLVVADDYGRTDARIPMLHSSIYRLTPSRATDKQIENYLSSLIRESMITVYRVNEKPYLQITNWLKYQTPRAKESRIPSMDDGENICKHLQTSANRHLHPHECATRASNTNSEYDIPNTEYDKTNTGESADMLAIDYCQDAINAWKPIHTPRGSVPECRRAWAAVMKLPKADKPSEPDLYHACVNYCASCATRDSYTKQFKYFLSPSSRPYEEYLPSNYHPEQHKPLPVNITPTGGTNNVSRFESRIRRSGA